MHDLAAVVAGPDVLRLEDRHIVREHQLGAHGERAALGRDVSSEPAGCLVLRPDYYLRGNLLAASVPCLRATVGEGTPVRAVTDAWSHAGDRLQLKAGADIGCCRHQCARVRMR